MKKIISHVTSILVILTALLFVVTSEARTDVGYSHIAASGSKVFIFNPKTLHWAVYEANGDLIRSGRAVGGKRYCPDVKRGCRTPVGSYRIYQKEGPNFVSSKYPLPYGGARMPWAMFFYKGFAIHGSNDMPSRHASHGCIRVYPSDARWLSSILPRGTRVIVKPY